MIHSKIDPGPLGLPVDVFLARSEAYLGHLNSFNVPETIKIVPLGDKKGGERWAQKSIFPVVPWGQRKRQNAHF